MNPLVTTREADALIRAALPHLGTERIPLAMSIGRTLAHAVVADRDLPPYPRAMMDGIAFASSSTPPFELQGLHAAGDPPPPALRAGHAWEIMTGACLPADCDTVVPYEHLSADHRNLIEPWRAGQCIHLAGSDAESGDTLVPAGQTIGAAEIAIAASVGLSQLEVIRHPRIALISSGNEAVPVNQTPEAWQIRRSNGPMLDALLNHAGMPPALHLHVADDETSTRQAIDQALAAADVVILCGGISKGKKDLMRPLLDERLGAPLFHGVLQKPGKPLAMWAGPPLAFALPGNPVSVLATFSRFVIPALHAMAGHDPAPRLKACPAGIASLDKLAWLLAIDTQGQPRVVANSGDYVSLSGTIGFLEVPPGINTRTPTLLSFYPCTP